MKLAHISEASYYGQHPFVKEFFDDLWDPNARAKTDIPKDLSIKDITQLFTYKFGEPYAHAKDLIQWEIEIPDALVDSDPYYDGMSCWVEIYTDRHEVHTTWE